MADPIEPQYVFTQRQLTHVIGAAYVHAARKYCDDVTYWSDIPTKDAEAWVTSNLPILEAYRIPATTK